MNILLKPLYNLLALSLLFLAASGCKKEENDKNAERRLILKDRFEGSYSLLTATSNVAVDLNFDGVKSNNMLNEVENLRNSNLILHFPYQSDVIIFDQFWQIQQFPFNDTRSVYNPKSIPGYANQPAITRVTFNNELNAMDLEEPANYDADKYPLPSSVSILQGDIISTTTTRKVYTTTGWTKIIIEARYKRYYKPE